jgi:ABC-2 type transport system ATP-binding protein
MSPQAPELVFEAADLDYAYGRKDFALSGVTFSVKKGEFCALLGPNGAGKSTLISLITRLFEAAKGEIRINGSDVAKETSKALAQMGVVFQQPTLDLDLSVQQNLIYFSSLHGIPRKTALHRIDEELERLGLSQRRFDKVRLLNGGHRRRVEIARALLHRPSFLLLDEPTVGLDVPTRRDIVEYLHNLCRSQKVSVLAATHLIDEVKTDDHLVVLHQGRVCAKGPVEEVVSKTGQNDLASAFSHLTEA